MSVIDYQTVSDFITQIVLIYDHVVKLKKNIKKYLDIINIFYNRKKIKPFEDCSNITQLT
jgi:hypothetical protein